MLYIQRRFLLNMGREWMLIMPTHKHFSCGGDVGKVQWHGTIKVEMLVHILFVYIHFGFLCIYFWSIFSCPILTCAAESRSHFWYNYYWWKIVKMSLNISTLTTLKIVGLELVLIRPNRLIVSSSINNCCNLIFVCSYLAHDKKLIISLWDDMVLDLNENRSKYCVCEKYWGHNLFSTLYIMIII